MGWRVGQLITRRRGACCVSRAPLCPLVLCLAVCFTQGAAVAQRPPVLPASLPDQSLLEVLERKGSLSLKQATLVEAMFALRQQWQVDMVMSSSLDGEVNATFVNASLREILDSLLISRGYGYQVVGRSLVVLPLDQLGALKPLFGTEVIAVQNGNPEELLDVVQLLLSPQGKALALKSPRSLMVMDYPDRMQLIRSRIEMLDDASRGSVAGTAGDPRSGPAPTPASRNDFPGSGAISAGPGSALDVRVFRPQYVKVATLLPAIESLISDDGRVAVLDNEDQIVVADHPDLMNVIEEAVAALDRPRSQVRIWAMIYDCSLEDAERIGVNWNGSVFGNSRRADGITPADSAALTSLTAIAPPAGMANSALTLMSLGTNVDVTAVINALRQSNDSRLLADPNVVVTNHEPAKIEIVTEIPYQQLTQGIQGGSIGTTAFREAGVTLEVTPHIARDQTIAMLVNPRFSVLSGFTQDSHQPIIDRREAKTTVRVRNGETFVLGGLRQRTKVLRNNGVPYLKDVKYIGKLFRSRDESFRESELLVFITPEIVSLEEPFRPREDAALEHGYENLNRNRHAQDDGYSSAEWDPQSYGGPLRGTRTELLSHSRVVRDARPDPDRAPYEDGGDSSLAPDVEIAGPFANGIVIEAPGSSEVSGRVRLEAIEPAPLTERLQHSVPVLESGSGRASRARTPASGPSGLLAPGDASGAGLNLNRLLQMLPMGGTQHPGQSGLPGTGQNQADALPR